MISLDQSIIWQCEYKRNHRSKYQKRIRCFPTHSKIGHQECGFCGQSIVVNSNLHPEDENNFIVVAQFGKFPNEDKSAIKIGDELNAKIFKYKEYVESPFYMATPITDLHISFIVNSKLTPWRYSAAIYNRHQLTTLYIYLFMRNLDSLEPNMFKCLEIINTPPFTLSTSLKIKKDSTNNAMEIETKQDDEEEKKKNVNVVKPISQEKTTIESLKINELKQMNDDIDTSPITIIKPKILMNQEKLNKKIQSKQNEQPLVQEFSVKESINPMYLEDPLLSLSPPAPPPPPPPSIPPPQSLQQQQLSLSFIPLQLTPNSSSLSLTPLPKDFSNGSITSLPEYNNNDHFFEPEPLNKRIYQNNRKSHGSNKNYYNGIKVEKFKKKGFEPISPDSSPKSEHNILKMELANMDNVKSHTYIKMKDKKNQDKEEDLCRFFKMKLKAKKRVEFDPYGRTVNSPKFLFEKPPIYQIDSKGNMCPVNPYPKDVRFSDKH